MAAIIAVLIYRAAKRHREGLLGQTRTLPATSVPLLSAAAVLGIGRGGFADGIVLHQILQWHEMLTNKVPPYTVLS
ncbi:hypothetical protein DJ568_05580 [Mucilaginibacter hurinus]|uniref:Uncharacterized protein n=2 Tax=Mucilaginibacter hurinus TaxID=2201324 RepID=A0A367GU04_9SPHI|nr:hypothetical protein DJ568_05580 [Mucilaginibacter hurinus]